MDKFLESFWRKNFFMGGENFKFGEICHFERSALAQSEKSVEFKIHLKALKSHFDFLDTSLYYAKFSMTM